MQTPYRLVINHFLLRFSLGISNLTYFFSVWSINDTSSYDLKRLRGLKLLLSIVSILIQNNVYMKGFLNCDWVIRIFILISDH